MDHKSKLSRREFVKIAALGAGTIALAGGGIGFIEGCSGPARSGRSFLSQDEYRLVEAIAEQIIPTDDWPGGRDAGVANFIDIQLAGPYRRFQQDYRRGLAAIENSCLTAYKKSFGELASDTQTKFLSDMEAGSLTEETWKRVSSKYFFELMRSHCLQGYYGSPRHGGNKNFVSYRMIDLDPLQTVGENRHGI